MPDQQHMRSYCWIASQSLSHSYSIVADKFAGCVGYTCSWADYASGWHLNAQHKWRFVISHSFSSYFVRTRRLWKRQYTIMSSLWCCAATCLPRCRCLNIMFLRLSLPTPVLPTKIRVLFQNISKLGRLGLLLAMTAAITARACLSYSLRVLLQREKLVAASCMLHCGMHCPSVTVHLTVHNRTTW